MSFWSFVTLKGLYPIMPSLLLSLPHTLPSESHPSSPRSALTFSLLVDVLPAAKSQGWWTYINTHTHNGGCWEVPRQSFPSLQHGLFPWEIQHRPGALSTTFFLWPNYNRLAEEGGEKMGESMSLINFYCSRLITHPSARRNCSVWKCTFACSAPLLLVLLFSRIQDATVLTPWSFAWAALKISSFSSLEERGWGWVAAEALQGCRAQFCDIQGQEWWNHINRASDSFLRDSGTTFFLPVGCINY